MLDLETLTNKQVVKACYLADIAFNEIKLFTYCKERRSFILNDDSDFEYNLQHIAFDDDFKIFLVEYDSPFDKADWEWNTPSVDRYAKVIPLIKEEVVQLKDLIAED